MNSFRIFIFIFCRKIARTCNIAGAFVFVVFDGKYKKKEEGEICQQRFAGERKSCFRCIYSVHVHSSLSLNEGVTLPFLTTESYY